MNGWRALAVACIMAVGASGCAHRAQQGEGARAGGGRGGYAGRGGFRGRGDRAEAVQAPTAPAREASVQPTDAIAGIVAPLQNVAVTSSLSEPALSVDVNEGDHVRAGETLALFDTSDLQANYEALLRQASSDEAHTAATRYQAQLTFEQTPQQVTQARQALAQARQTLTNDQVNLTRDRQLVSQGYIAQQTVDQQQTLVTNDQAAVRSAQAALAQAVSNQQVNGTAQKGLQAANVAEAEADAASARAQARQIEAEIVRARIVSPVDGIVVNRNLNPGEYPNGRTLFTIQELSQVYVELNASSADVFRIRAGAPVTVRAGDDQTNHVYRGSVVAVLGQVQPGSTNFTVKAIVGNPDGRLQAGIPVTATISLPATRGIGIPTTAFLDDTHSSVMVDRNGVATVAGVTELASDGTTSIVRGLPAGAAVVVNGQLGLTSGQRLSER